MSSENENAWVKTITEALSKEKARNTVHDYILGDMIVEIAKTQQDPGQFITEMFQRVGRLIDQGEVGSRTADTYTEMLRVNESFFTKASEAVQK